MPTARAKPSKPAPRASAKPRRAAPRRAAPKTATGRRAKRADWPPVAMQQAASPRTPPISTPDVASPLPPPVASAPPAVPAPPASAPSGGSRPRIGIGAWVSVLVMALLLGAVALGVPAIAHRDANHGTIKVHDEEQASPAQRNEPHVDCEDFWIEGFNMSDGSGGLTIISWAPTGDNSVVLESDWSADAHDHEKGGFHMLAGPFTLPAGHYRVEVYNDGGHPGNEKHFAKAKMFWVEPCESEAAIVCPTGLVAVAAEGGGFELTWTPAEGSDGTNVYRAAGSEDFELLTTVDAGVGEFVDTDVEMGVTYTYTVTGLFSKEESTNCVEVEVSMIPNFPTLLAAGAATVGGVLAYAFVARRRR